MRTLQQNRKIVIAGGSGFLGTALVARLRAAGYDIVVLSRHRAAGNSAAAPRTVTWTPDGGVGHWATELDGAHAVINLAGESIAARRWTPPQKARIVGSRVQGTRSLTAAIGAAAAPPPVFVSASAIGYYGPCGDERVTETTAAGRDFLADVCVQWEDEAMRAASQRTRVVTVRTGLVVAREGGALPQMLPPFRVGVGGPIGSGRQYWPWIHRDDWLAMVQFAIETPALNSAMNATGPAPVTNAEFAKALGRAMRRPALLPAPAFALRLLLGEMADGLLLAGQRAFPDRATRLGFAFRYTTIDAALAHLFERS